MPPRKEPADKPAEENIERTGDVEILDLDDNGLLLLARATGAGQASPAARELERRGYRFDPSAGEWALPLGGRSIRMEEQAGDDVPAQSKPDDDDDQAEPADELGTGAGETTEVDTEPVAAVEDEPDDADGEGEDEDDGPQGEVVPEPVSRLIAALIECAELGTLPPPRMLLETAFGEPVEGTEWCSACRGNGVRVAGLRIHPDYKACDSCDGEGKVLTGSKVLMEYDVDCPDCLGRGYLARRPEPDLTPFTVTLPDDGAGAIDAGAPDLSMFRAVR